MPSITIRVKLMGAFLLSILLAIGSTLILASWKLNTARLESYTQSTTAQLSRINSYIELMFSQAKQNAAALARMDIVRAAVGTLPDYVHNQQPKRVPREEMTAQTRLVDELFQTVVETHPLYASITLGAEDGGFLEYPLATWPAGHDPRTRSWYQAQKASAQSTAISAAYTSVQGTSACAATAKVIGQDGKLLGVIDIDIQLTSLMKMISSIRQGKTGYLMLVEDSGVILADPQHPEWLYKNMRNVDIPVFKDLLSRQNDLLIGDIGGTEKVIVEYTGYNGWKLIAIMDRAEVFESITGTIQDLIIMGICVAALLLLIAFALASGIRKPIMMIVDASRAIATGKLDALPPAQHFEGEMRTLHASLEHMVENLVGLIKTAEAKNVEAETQTQLARDALQQAESARRSAETARRKGTILTATQLEGVVQAVNKAAQELHEKTHSARASAGTQRERATETVKVMEKMNASVLEVCSNADEAARNVENARQEAEDGGKLMQEVVSSVSHVQEVARDLDRQLTELGRKAQDISRIMDMISDVADQTNLLALNAAIEAARAGEAGRGFAVVADEVRKLAEKTMSATGEVATVVRAIQEGAGASAEGMHNVAELIDYSTELASDAGEALKRIVSMVQNSASQVRSIATVSERQSATSAEMARNSHAVNKIATEVAEIMDEAGVSVGDLSQEATELEQIIARLKNEG